jgi:hypothetical protein
MTAENANRASGAALGYIIASLVFIGLIVVVRFSIHVPSIDEARAAARSKALADIRATEN